MGEQEGEKKGELGAAGVVPDSISNLQTFANIKGMSQD